jgi:hypothetical protein
MTPTQISKHGMKLTQISKHGMTDGCGCGRLGSAQGLQALQT